MPKYLGQLLRFNINLKIVYCFMSFLNSSFCFSQNKDTIFALVEKSIILRGNPSLIIKSDDSMIKVESTYFGRDSIFRVYIFLLEVDTMSYGLKDTAFKKSEQPYCLIIKGIFRNHYFGFNSNIWRCIIQNEGLLNVRKEKFWKFKYPVILFSLCEHLARLPNRKMKN